MFRPDLVKFSHFHTLPCSYSLTFTFYTKCVGMLIIHFLANFLHVKLQFNCSLVISGQTEIIVDLCLSAMLL